MYNIGKLAISTKTFKKKKFEYKKVFIKRLRNLIFFIFLLEKTHNLVKKPNFLPTGYQIVYQMYISFILTR